MGCRARFAVSGNICYKYDYDYYIIIIKIMIIIIIIKITIIIIFTKIMIIIKPPLQRGGLYVKTLSFGLLMLITVFNRSLVCCQRSAILAGLPAVQLDRLQSVLNAAAQLIYRSQKFHHASPLLKELHWLRVPERITFWLAVLAYRCQHNMAPRYFTAQLKRASNVGYRQSSSAMLNVPHTEQVTIGGRAFSATAARVWNSLPTAVQSSESLDIFRCRLKTELFERSYN